MMEVFNILLLVAFLLISVHEIIYVEERPIKTLIFVLLAVWTFISFVYETSKLDDRAAFNGRSEYVETIHISKGDTIKTYYIQSKE